MRRTLHDLRLAHAYGVVKIIAAQPAMAPAYLALARKFPTMIQRNGLGQALSFLEVRKERNEFALMLAHLAGWITTRGILTTPLLAKYIAANFEDARRSEHEALAWAIVNKSMAEAMITRTTRQ